MHVKRLMRGMLTVTAVSGALYGMSVASAGAATNKSSHYASDFVIKYATQWNTGFPAVESDQWFMKTLTAQTHGHIQFQYYLNGILGGTAGALTGVESGSIQMADFTPALISGTITGFNLLGTPFITTSAQANYNLLTKSSYVQRLIKQTSTALGIDLVGFLPGGLLTIATSNKPVYLPSDLVGEKIRTGGTASENQAISNWGGIPEALNGNEIFTALQSGAVQGVDTPELTDVLQKYNTVAPYITNLDYGTSTPAVFVNGAFFNSLPPKYRTLLKADEKIATEKCNAFYAVANKTVAAVITGQGGTVINLTKAQRQVWISANAPVIASAIQQYGAKLVKEVQAYN
jgi:TRAP-type C4-dicarboxylate transport system substrate-binding protein